MEPVEAPEDLAPTDEERLRMLMRAVGHEFASEALLVEALTHASHRNESEDVFVDNERLEFLGDSILGAVVADLLVRAFPEEREGALTRYKAVLVSEPGLAKAARRLGLGDYLWLGKGEESTGGRQKDSVLANALEALIAALYLDAGFDRTYLFIRALYGDRVASVGQTERRIDFKTKLQERVQMLHRTTPSYRIVAEKGPDHARLFEAAVLISGEIVALGEGRSKKAAQQSAAAAAWETLDAQEDED